ncbi:C39 family peptidase [Marinoscillum furvescens]|uniref:Peptidase C39-like protein n=1 Tax=Marinoscillum furvescens DSM 4134 TaxID=1122208 RepID=A0A3D9LH27_MARFU|nr:C39 family peptidase [Marinoscillum furvescens]REE05701.1 peptidase C39-like protein [Marinoscillum furvescens DSM 4134]
MDVKTLRFDIHAQPNDETCGPTCLQAVYQYHDDTIELSEVIATVKTLQTGGTLGVMLGNHALARGYQATLFTYNLKMFDPSWFTGEVDLNAKLKEQRKHKTSKKFQVATDAYLRFLELGGKIRFKELNTKLIKRILNQGNPILTGLSATYLYNCPREIGELNEYHDIKGEPMGHFVVIYGYDIASKTVHIADPLKANPISETQHYEVTLQRVINSILLGILTYDANLLVIHPKNV